MTTLELIKMLVEQAIKENSGDCIDCTFSEVDADEYPCCKCKRTCLYYYKEGDRKHD